jgi:hypothetical protein
MDHRVQAKRTNQYHLVLSAVESQFQDAVGQIAHQLGRYSWQPAPQQAHELVGSHARRFVPQT